MSDTRCARHDVHDPHAWGELNWCPGVVERPMTLTDFLLARIAEDEAVVEAHINDEPFPSGWSAAVRTNLASYRAVVDLARDYSPELEHGDNGEWAFDAVLHTLALPYADHPDYREEWKP